MARELARAEPDEARREAAGYGRMSALMHKALEAASAARLMLESELYASACGRAYYAMFNSARVLLSDIAGMDIDNIRSHRAVMRNFSLHFVRTGRFDADLARQFTEAAEVRAVADYDDSPMDASEAEESLRVMELFLARVEALLREAGK